MPLPLDRHGALQPGLLGHVLHRGPRPCLCHTPWSFRSRLLGHGECREALCTAYQLEERRRGLCTFWPEGRRPHMVFSLGRVCGVGCMGNRGVRTEHRDPREDWWGFWTVAFSGALVSLTTCQNRFEVYLSFTQASVMENMRKAFMLSCSVLQAGLSSSLSTYTHTRVLN